MKYKLYNTLTNKLETHFKILPDGQVENEWGGICDQTIFKLLRGTGVIDEGREIFEHDLYLDDDHNLYEVTYKHGSFAFENDYTDEFYVHENCDSLRRSRYIGNAYIDPEIYEKYNILIHET